ncbi:hypothetical protein L6472_05970 [Prevotella sp. E13-17]|uniref:hypothetical protein n=1 Tax=Prevotella sp. E13-17 TaxID=2913616 RepID=UPI001EDB1141|nr:hypothetical protein [Prevotella sp. E13-17]UKK52124.1 hypothetical protein L6472_05970 [Prevotella sp. E13-17]
MMEQVYVSWYNKVVAGEIINHNDMFGMTAVRIPIQGVQATVLYTPQHVYKTVQEACGDYPKHFPTLGEFKHSEPPSNVGATIERAIQDAKLIQKVPSEAWVRLQEFKKNHWDTEHNHLCIDALEEFYRLWVEGVSARRTMMMTKPQQCMMHQEKPATPDETMNYKQMRPRQKKEVTELTLFT